MNAGVPGPRTKPGKETPAGRKVWNDRKAAASFALNEQRQYNFDQASLAGGSYSKALFQSEARNLRTEYIPVEGKQDTYEIGYSYNLWIYANQAVNPGGKDQVLPRTFKTGVQVQKGKDGNFTSTKYTAPTLEGRTVDITN